MNELDADITIVGGGPIGLYLAGRLIQHGISCKVLEKKSAIDRHSKSLGIHPVSLELFDRAGIVEFFLEEGLKIKKGNAFWNTEKIGEISFEKCPPPFSYILALPQWQTETILESWLNDLDKNSLIRGSDVRNIIQSEDSVDVSFMLDGAEHSITSRFLVGCDGKNSTVRRACNIDFIGGSYPDSYIMGDFEDNTSFDSDAAVYLHQDGLIESFPLPNQQRRWVVKTDSYIEKPTIDQLKLLVNQRVGHSLDGIKHFMISSFGVQQFSAKTYHQKNVLLAGDAAHVVSPIGGQGMNLGWLDAEKACTVIIKSLKSDKNRDQWFQDYSDERRKITKQVSKRAEINMHLGRKESSNLFNKIMLKSVLQTRLNRLLAKVFTMRGLGRWWL